MGENERNEEESCVSTWLILSLGICWKWNAESSNIWQKYKGKFGVMTGKIDLEEMESVQETAGEVEAATKSDSAE